MACDVRPPKRLRLMDGVQHTNTEESAHYDVFISHRGPDTKSGFVSFLHKELTRVGLRAFLDCKSIDIGDDSWESIESAIKNSSIAVVVFSKSFAQSEWCLKELHVMFHTPSVKVLPVFYKVQPSEVRRPESGELKDGFEKLTRRHPKGIIDEWRANLEQASKIMGWEHSCAHERMEGDLVEEIVEKILVLANKPLPLDVGEYVVGVKEVAGHLIQTLDNKKEVMMLGLWGMGGIGKSTLARELYNQLRRRFSASCFIDDVTDKVIQGGVEKVQNCIWKELFPNEVEKISNKSKGKTFLEERLRKKQILMVLDDVRDNDEMAYWVTQKMLGESSICIATSRNRRIFETLNSFDMNNEVYIHEVSRLSIANSYQVFVNHAFGGDLEVKSELEPMVRNISKACGGIPLVLRVCGALLKNRKDVKIWEAVMKKLDCGTIMDEEKIFDCLSISYNSLSRQDQEMFLDIACALIGQYKDYAISLWESNGWSGRLGIESLIEKALVTVDDMGCFSMHDHIRDMGRELERRARGDRGIRRLWMPESLTKLNDEELPTSLQVLVINGSYLHNNLNVSGMQDLRILICNGTINVMSSLPKSLGLVQMEVITNPLLVPTKNKLLILKCNRYELELLSDSIANASNLEVLDLSYCSQLTLLPQSFGSLKKPRDIKLYESGIRSLPESFGELSNLEVLDLRYCSHLTLLPQSFGSLKKLRDINLCNSGIRSLPESFGKLSNLEVLNLRYCSCLTLLPQSFGSLKKLRDIKLYYSGIQSLSESFAELSNLEVLDLFGCSQLTLLPQSFGSLKKLRDIKLYSSGIQSLSESFGELSNLELLDLRWCSQLTLLPQSFGSLKKLRDIKLYSSGIQSLSESFGELSNLKVLDLSDCSQLTLLPQSFGSLKKLRNIMLCNSRIQRLPESFGELSNLEVLDLGGCFQLALLPQSFGSLKKLRDIKLCNSGIESLPESFGELSNLEVLDLGGCSHFKQLPHSFGRLKGLKTIKLYNLGIKSLPKSFGELLNLVHLNVENCTELIEFPMSLRDLLNIRELVLTGSAIESFLASCGVLRQFEASNLRSKLEILSNLSGYLNNQVELDLSCSKFNELPPCLEGLKNLEVLSLSFCKNLTLLPSYFGRLQRLWNLKLESSRICCLPESFGELKKLKVLNLSTCLELTFLPDSFGCLENLRILQLDHSGINHLPESFGDLSLLESLDMTHCHKLIELPESFGTLSNLRDLNLRCATKINSLPMTIGGLSNLEHLNLGCCKELTRLPDSLGSLKNLRTLDMGATSLKSLPTTFGGLSNLEHLILRCCEKLTVLPTSFERLRNLKTFNLCATGLTSLPTSFHELVYLQELDLSFCWSLKGIAQPLSHLTNLYAYDVKINF